MTTPETTTPTPPQTIGTLEDIELKKAFLREDIKKDETKMGKMWHDMFYQEVPPSGMARVMAFVNSGAGVIDGLILGWKLYHRFKKFPFIRRSR